jgi:hypothetical protein
MDLSTRLFLVAPALLLSAGFAQELTYTSRGG